MQNRNSSRTIKRTVRLNQDEDSLFKENLKKSGLDASSFMRQQMLSPCGKNISDSDDTDSDREPPTSKFIMSNEEREKQRKGIEGLIMAGIVIYQILRGKGKKKNWIKLDI